MKCEVPTSVLIAWFAVGLYVVYLAVVLAICVMHGVPPSPGTLFHFVGGVLFLAGMWRMSRLAWQIGLAVLAIVGTAELFYGVSFLLLFFRDPTWFFNGIWALFVGIYMYIIFYLLRRPASRNYFTSPEKG